MLTVPKTSREWENAGKSESPPDGSCCRRYRREFQESALPWETPLRGKAAEPLEWRTAASAAHSLTIFPQLVSPRDPNVAGQHLPIASRWRHCGRRNAHTRQLLPCVHDECFEIPAPEDARADIPAHLRKSNCKTRSHLLGAIG